MDGRYIVNTEEAKTLNTWSWW